MAHDPVIAVWLADTQEADGCWRRYPSPFAKPGEKAYETHVSWGFLEAARLDSERRWSDAALRQVRWALAHQHENGWLAECCLNDASRPLTHTRGYALKGIVEAWRFSRDERFLVGARKLADGLRSAVRADGKLPGRLYSDWTPAVAWVCLTGCVQIAWSWIALYQDTRETLYRDAAYNVNCFVRRTVSLTGPPGCRGGVKGAFPVDGD